MGWDREQAGMRVHRFIRLEVMEQSGLMGVGRGSLLGEGVMVEHNTCNLTACFPTQLVLTCEPVLMSGMIYIKWPILHVAIEGNLARY